MSPDLTPQQLPPHRPYRALLLKVGAGLGAVVVLGSIAVTIWGKRVINGKVLPLVEAQVEDMIERPIELGDLERLSLSAIQLGKTTLPPTTTDASSVIVDRIVVGWDVRSLLFNKTLKPDIVLVRPELSVVQGDDGQWVELSLPEASDEEPPITTEIQSIKIRDAQLSVSTANQTSQALVPREPVVVTGADITAKFYGEESKQVYFDLTGDVEAGRFAIEGEGDLANPAVKANVRVSDLPTKGANLALPSILGLTSGTLNTNLTLAAALNEDGELDPASVDVRGTAQLRDGQLVVQDLPDSVRNIQTQLRFKGQQVTLDEAELRLGDVALLTQGTVDWENGYDLSIQIPEVSLADVQTLATLDLPDDLPLDKTVPFELKTQISGDLSDPRVQGRLASLAPLPVDKLDLAKVSADFVLPLSDYQLTTFELTELRIVPDAGGVILAEGQADLEDLENLSFELTAEADVPVDAVVQPYGVALPGDTTIGALKVNLELDGNLETQTAVAQWQLRDSSFPGQGQLTFADNQLTINNAQIQPEAGGAIVADGSINLADIANPSFALTAQATLPIDTLAQSYGVALPSSLPPDTVLGVLTADVAATGTLKSPTANVQWQLSDSSYPGQGEIALADNQLAINNTRLQVAGGWVTAAATAQLDSGNWQATLTTDQVAVEQFTPQAQGLLTANVEAAGNLNELDLSKIQATGGAAIANAQINLPVNQADTLAGTQTPLLTPGDWATQFAWQGDNVAIDYFTAPGIQADGTIGVDLGQPVPIGDLALNVVLERINLAPFNRLAPANVQTYGHLAGFTSFAGHISGPLTSPQLTGNAKLDELTLNDITFEPLAGPVALSLQNGGTVDLTSQQQDRLQLSLNNQLWPVAFEVRNRYKITNQNGDQETLQTDELDTITYQEFSLTGRGENNQLDVEITQFPLDKLNIQPAADYGFETVAGIVNGRAAIDLADLANPSVSGSLTIEQPSLSPIDAQKIVADFNYADGVANLSRGELAIKDSRYALSGTAIFTPEIDYNGTLTVEQGRIEDIIALLEDIDLSKFGAQSLPISEATAADLTVDPVALPPNDLSENSFLKQLQAFDTFLNNRSQPGTAAFSPPSLAALSGGFTGTIAVAGRSLSLDEVAVDVDLAGDSWQWGENTAANNFVINGGFTSGPSNGNQPATINVDVEQVDINAGETQISLSGNGTPQQLKGQLTVNKLPVELATWVYPSLPVAPAGDLEIATQFDGSLENPKIKGTARVDNAQINDYPLALVETDFEYRNASLVVDSAVSLDAADTPITLNGTIPYALPFIAVKPRTNQLALKAIVPSDNFDIVNTVTQEQIRWEEGSGEIVAQVSGPLSQPNIEGNARFRQGVIGSNFLEDPVTDLTGDVQFGLTLTGQQYSFGEYTVPFIPGKLTIPQLQANLKDGRLQVDGQLPLSPLDQPADGITIALEELPINYNGVLKSIFDGQITLDGSALEMTVGGNLAIGAGRISTFKLAQGQGNNNVSEETALEANTDPDAADTDPDAVDDEQLNNPIYRQIATAATIYRDERAGV
ncbi:MAG: translocation/assembly module TamB domain-containing protein, partial [Leptolyngbyaceae cyanobacterium MAG.088]|nr:translocation/assembly module TamB domain-containing protein [Leptolyngbyaceae cyanobacterium MAG.088]